MLMRLLTPIAALVFSTTIAFAQTPAVKSPNANNPAAPVAGANSFTEGQAKTHIEVSRVHAGIRPQERRQRHLARLGHEGREEG